MLYNTGEKSQAAEKYNSFEIANAKPGMKIDDQDMLSTIAKIGPVLHLGT